MTAFIPLVFANVQGYRFEYSFRTTTCTVHSTCGSSVWLMHCRCRQCTCVVHSVGGWRGVHRGCWMACPLWCWLTCQDRWLLLRHLNHLLLCPTGGQRLSYLLSCSVHLCWSTVMNDCGPQLSSLWTVGPHVLAWSSPGAWPGPGLHLSW